MDIVNKVTNKAATIGNIAEVIGVVLPESINKNAQYNRVHTQHVYVKAGDVVISAGWYPNVETVKESLKRGALVVFCDAETKKHFSEDNVIAVENPLDCVTKFQNYRAQFGNAKRIAITGSVGKTTTTGLINSVIANSFNTLTHHSASNSHGAVLRNVQRLEPSHEYWVQEVGGVQPRYVESTARFLRPDIVVLTNIGESHLNLYGTKQNILLDKGSLERYAQPDGVVIINKDDDMLSSAVFSHKVITCSLKDPTADYYGDQIRTDLDGIHFIAYSKGEEVKVHLNLYGDYNAYNALFALAVGVTAGLSMHRCAELLETYFPNGMRQNMTQIGGYKFLVDTFNAEPKTVLGSAETLTKIPVTGNGRRIFATGHIDKLGLDSAKMHEALGRDMAKLNIDRILLFAEDAKYIYKGLVESGYDKALLMESREELDDWLRNNVTREDIVFFKSGQFAAALAKTIDHVFGTAYQNEQQFNEGRVVDYKGYKLRLRMDNIAEVEGYTGSEKKLVLPETYENYNAIRIAPFAFTKQRNIVSVSIPDTVTNIGKEAFYICPKLKSVKLPRNLKIIEKNAFNYCKALETVEIPDGTIHIDRRAFYDCFSLKYVIIPESVGFISEDAFDSDKGRNTKLKFICKPGSYAAEYAEKSGFEICDVDVFVSEQQKARQKIVPYPEMDKKSQGIFDMVKNEIGVEPAPLTAEEMQIFKLTWGEYYERGIAKPQWAGLYKAKTGVFNPEFIGHDIHLHNVEKKLVDQGYIRGLCDKNVMPLVLPIGKHPATLIRKLAGIYLDGDFNNVDEQEAVNIIMDNRRRGAVIKLCRSSGGKDVHFVSEETTRVEILRVLRKSQYITVQRVVKQHPEMARMNSSSVNTIRIMTIMVNGKSRVLSSVVRIGKVGSKVDNFHSGGVSCGIKPDGSLNAFASDMNGNRTSVHSNGFVFANGKVPNYDRVCNEAMKLHYCVPVFGIISWDFCIDEIGDPVFIEYNIGGGITVHQLSNGPLYGKYREEIMDMVFNDVQTQTDAYKGNAFPTGEIFAAADNISEHLIIPKMVDGRQVVAVGENVLNGNRTLKSVTFEGDIHELQRFSFRMCKQLEKVEFKGTVKIIGRSAFNECVSLEEVFLPEGTQKIDRYAFAGCHKLKALHIPASVEEIASDILYHSPNALIYCKSNSYAEQFAKINKIKYIIE